MKLASWANCFGFGLIAVGTFFGAQAWSRLEALEGEVQTLRTRVAQLDAARSESGDPGLLRGQSENSALQAAPGRWPPSSGPAESVPEEAANPAQTPQATPEPPNRARLGISIADVSERRGSNPSLNLPDGVLVTQVVPNSPAAQSGLAANDVILEVDGNPSPSAAEFKDAVARRTPGATVTLVVFRQGLNLRIVSATDRWADDPQ